MCRVLRVSRSGFYAWLKRPESDRDKENRHLDTLIRAEYEKSRQRSGSIKITEALKRKDNGIKIYRTKVAKRMQLMGIRSKVKRKFKVTTDSSHKEPVAPNILNREFTVDAPNKVWVSDITYLYTSAGWVYLSIILDLFSRMIVGWDVSYSLNHNSLVRAFWKAIMKRRPDSGMIFHSDRGVQYACKDFRDLLTSMNFIQSMSRKGDCWDNSVAESFFRTLKTEWYFGEKWDNINQIKSELFQYIELFYNCQRLHASLGYVTPKEFECNQIVLCG